MEDNKLLPRISRGEVGVREFENIQRARVPGDDNLSTGALAKTSLGLPVLRMGVCGCKSIVRMGRVRNKKSEKK